MTTIGRAASPTGNMASRHIAAKQTNLCAMSGTKRTRLSNLQSVAQSEPVARVALATKPEGQSERHQVTTIVEIKDKQTVCPSIYS
jgi:hypothetical protein